MLRRSRLLCALAAIAVLAIAAPAQAQNSPIRVLVTNNTPNCMWLTFYRWDSSGIFGTAGGPQIIGSPRSQTGPLAIAPHKGFEFTLPRVRRFKVRTESMNANCVGNVGGDTSSEVEDAGNIDYYHFILMGSNRSLWIERRR